MPVSQPYVLVIWGSRCQEAPAAIFVTVLRAAGLPVKLIGIGGPRSAGSHGLILSADFSLGEALQVAPAASCVIVVCPAALLRRFYDDPRFGELLAIVRTGGMHVVVGDEASVDALGMRGYGPIEVAPGGDGLFGYAQRLAATLCALKNGR